MNIVAANARMLLLTMPLVALAAGAQEPNALAEQGCIACHALHETRIGPSYAAIATRYGDADDRVVEVLTQKVLRGGAGNWGVVPMIAHDGLDAQAARDLVRWILRQDGPTSP